MIRLDTTGADSFLEASSIDAARARAVDAHNTLIRGTGKGAEFLGWRRILSSPDRELIAEVSRIAEEIRRRADVLLVIGIGGSYLGARAVIDALTPYFGDDDAPEVLFAGTDMSGAYLKDLMAHLQGKSVYVNVISKSGTTLEPAIAFRFVRSWLEETFDDADSRIIVTTDPDKGALNALRETHPYRKFVIPSDVGGRFSVLTPVGLLPVAVAGVDVESLFEGAVDCFRSLESEEGNTAIEYALVRNLLLDQGYATELLATFEPSIASFGGWWQQLFGESEGKEGKGIFPVSVRYSTDLHSLGQYVQDGRRTLFETFLIPDDDGGGLSVQADEENLDGLNYLDGKTLTYINGQAFKGTAHAHQEGGVPVLTLRMVDISPRTVGALIYFFEHAVAVSGYMLDVNPFDQPGVEAYKKEMFSLLGKPL